jgi:C1A family cysteine protease
MPMRIGLDQLQQEIRDAGAVWEADVTPHSQHSEAQAKNRLGYVPGPDDLSLEDAEQRARASLAAAPPAAPAAPPSFDWRNAKGGNYVTPIEDQSSCGSCVAFGSIAAMESLVRISRNAPNLSVDLSEAQLFFCYGPEKGAGRCPGGGWWPDAAYESMKTGVVDAACFPYTPNDQPCNLCANWQGRLTKITGWHKEANVAGMKAFLSTVGPLSACFTVYEDFYYHYTSGVYTHVSGNAVGGHCVCIVGYDDAQNCWIAKNSWGTGWGESGFFRIGYGQCGIDAEMWAPEGIVASGWAELYSDADTLTTVDVGRNQDGRLEVFGVNAAGNIFHTWQTKPNNGWYGSWAELYTNNDNLVTLDVGRNQDGRLEVFGISAAGNIFHTWQTKPNNGWNGSWAELYTNNDNLTTLRVTNDADGRLEVFGINAAGNIFHTWQTKPNNGWNGSWAELYTNNDNLVMLDPAGNQDGRIEVFGVNPQGHIFHTWQTAPNNGWNG